MRITAAVLLVLAVTACSRGTSDNTGADAKRGEIPPVAYGSGFFEVESDARGSWRWMGQEGIVLLANTGQPMVLRIVGRVPVAQLPEPPVLTIELNGEVLDQWHASNRVIEKEFTITPEQQGPGGRSELRIAASLSFVPREVDPQSPDRRRLSMTIRELHWQPQ